MGGCGVCMVARGSNVGPSERERTLRISVGIPFHLVYNVSGTVIALRLTIGVFPDLVVYRYGVAVFRCFH